MSTVPPISPKTPMATPPAAQAVATTPTSAPAPAASADPPPLPAPIIPLQCQACGATLSSSWTPKGGRIHVHQAADGNKCPAIGKKYVIHKDFTVEEQK